MATPPRLSLIVPCGPLETQPPQIARIDSLLPDDWEVIVSLGRDQSPDLPVHWKVVRGEFGRGAQLNRASRIAQGEWLWFVHADSLPDERALSDIKALIADSTVKQAHRILAYCRLSFDTDGPAATRLNAIGANWRSRWLHMPYGDQGQCLSRQTFQSIGGFRENLARGEDLDFVIRGRRVGLELIPLEGRMRTSARRYADEGWLKTTLRHQRAALRLLRGARA